MARLNEQHIFSVLQRERTPYVPFCVLVWQWVNLQISRANGFTERYLFGFRKVRPAFCWNDSYRIDFFFGNK